MFEGLLLAWVLATTSTDALAAAQKGCQGCRLAPFEMHYAVSRNGKALGSAHLSLTDDGGGLWTLQMAVEATKGLASIAGYKEIESSTLKADDLGWGVVAYERKRKVAFRNRDESMRFDWNAGQLWSERGGEQRQEALPANTVDSNSLTLLLGHQLRAGDGLASYPVARRGKVDRWRFDVAAEEIVDGFVVQRVERRRENSQRTTTSWFSAEHGYLPIRLQQVEEDGETITMSLQQALGAAAPKGQTE